MLRVRLSVLEAERAQLQGGLMAERQQNADLERMLEGARQRQSASDARVSSIIEQKAAMEVSGKCRTCTDRLTHQLIQLSNSGSANGQQHIPDRFDAALIHEPRGGSKFWASWRRW